MPDHEASDRVCGPRVRYRGSRLLLGLLVVLACLTRFHDLDGYPLWHDEAWVAASIAEPTLSGMMVDFDYPQTTPPLFLILVRGLVAVFGNGEAVLRFLPAAAGVLSAVLLWLLARRLTGSEKVAFLTMALWVASPRALHYSQELKQYATDALVTILLLYLTEVFVGQGEPERRARWKCVLVGATIVCLPLSYTAVLVIPAVVIRWAWAAFAGNDRGARRRELLEVGIYAATTSALFAFLHLIFVRPQYVPWLFDFWKGQFLSDHSALGFVQFAAWSSYHLFSFLFRHLNDLMLGYAVPIAAALFAVGIMSLMIAPPTA